MTETAFNAIISVYDKEGIEDFAQQLADQRVTNYASGGTAVRIEAADVPVTDVAELVGGDAMLNHRVVTLSREIHAGLLADDSPEHTAELAEKDIPRLDIVRVDMYPLRDAIDDPEATDESVLNKTDVGGPTMLHAGAKGRRIVVSRSEQQQGVIDWMRAGMPDKESFVRNLAGIAELEAADHILQSARYLGGRGVLGWIGERVSRPKYGENPGISESGLYANRYNNDPLAIHRFELRQGDEPSYNNYADIDRELQTATHIAAGFERNGKDVPCIAIGAKHGNACGAAVDTDPITAVKKMLEGDERAIFGGSIMLNFAIDKEVAEVLMAHNMKSGKRLLDVITAPYVTPEALKVLQRKEGKLRVLTNMALLDLGEGSLDTEVRTRYVRGGMLAQDNYTYVLDQTHPELKYNGKPTKRTLSNDSILAWAIAVTSNSNTITLVKDGMLIGNGVGQQDRVSAAELALKRARDAGHDTNGAVAHSDSFFPFADGLEVLINAGIKTVLTSEGSVNFADIVAAARKAKINLFTIPDKIMRGFYAH